MYVGRRLQNRSATINVEQKCRTKMASAMVIHALPKLSPIIDNIAIILKILLIIAIKKIVPIMVTLPSTQARNGITHQLLPYRKFIYTKKI